MFDIILEAATADPASEVISVKRAAHFDPTYICIDLKSYYASVECVHRGLDPLTANLLVADESRTDKTICLAVSPALKAIGVASRPRLFEAKEAIRLYEAQRHTKVSYIVAMPRMAEYERISALIYSVYLRYVSEEDIHVYSIDEVFLDATPYLHFYSDAGARAGMDPAHRMALTMIRDVLRTTGITATAGIGPNLYLAKVAMDITAKKAPPDADGVRIAALNEEEYKLRLWPYEPITAFWQVAGGTALRLAKYGVRTMGDVARMSLVNEDLLYRLFGVNAEILIDHAWGKEPCTIRDIKNYRPEARSLSVGQVLARPYPFREARLILAEMAEELSMRLLEKEQATDQLTFWVSFDEISLEHCDYGGPIVVNYYGRLVPKPVTGTTRLRTRTASTKLITAALLAAFDARVDPGLYVRRMGIAAGDTANACTQLDLFTDYAALEREEKIQRVVLSVRRKYGGNALLKGMDYLEGGTTRQRNEQIGGHRA